MVKFVATVTGNTEGLFCTELSNKNVAPCPFVELLELEAVVELLELEENVVLASFALLGVDGVIIGVDVVVDLF